MNLRGVHQNRTSLVNLKGEHNTEADIRISQGFSSKISCLCSVPPSIKATLIKLIGAQKNPDGLGIQKSLFIKHAFQLRYDCIGETCKVTDNQLISSVLKLQK